MRDLMMYSYYKLILYIKSKYYVYIKLVKIGNFGKNIFKKRSM